MELLIFLGILIATTMLLTFVGFCVDVGTRKGRGHRGRK